MNANFCTRCGAAIEPAQKIFCQSCGTAYHWGCYQQSGCASQTCPAAHARPAAVVSGAPATALQPGAPQPYVYNPTYYPKSRVAYILLGIFLGTLGIHNFYAGYTGRGIAQLLITVLTFGLGGIITFLWAVIEVCTVNADARGVAFAN